MKDDRLPSPDRAPDSVAEPPASGCSAHEGMRRLLQLLPRIMRGLRRRPGERVILDGVTLGSSHGSALALVREHECTVGALASSLDLSMATVSGLVADLEHVGFTERSPDPGDRRRTLVRVVPGSEGLVDSWLEGASAPIMRALQQLSPDERSVFVKGMHLLEAELNSPC